MKTTKKAAILLCAIVMSFASQGALADHPCAVEIDNVNLAIGDAVFNGKGATRDEDNMYLKVEAAIAKLHEEKYGDAIQKLMDISEKAEALAESPKSKLEDDAGIQSAILGAAVCINQL